MKRTPRELYDYEINRIDKYLVEMDEIINNAVKSDDASNRLKHLIEWYGNARAIKSKAYQDMKMTTLKAMQFLQKEGYFVDNLWKIEDVTSKFKDEIDEGDASYILDKALTNERIMEMINVSIMEIGEEEGLKLK
jgi:hypothetical protein